MVVDVILLACFEVIGNMALVRFVCWFPGLTDCGALVWVFAPVLVVCCWVLDCVCCEVWVWYVDDVAVLLC